MTKDRELNGSVDLLATAMRKVFIEATEQAVEPVIGLVNEGFEQGNVRIDKIGEQLDHIDRRQDHHQKEGP